MASALGLRHVDDVQPASTSALATRRPSRVRPGRTGHAEAGYRRALALFEATLARPRRGRRAPAAWPWRPPSAARLRRWSHEPSNADNPGDRTVLADSGTTLQEVDGHHQEAGERDHARHDDPVRYTATRHGRTLGPDELARLAPERPGSLGATSRTTPGATSGSRATPTTTRRRTTSKAFGHHQLHPGARHRRRRHRPRVLGRGRRLRLLGSTGSSVATVSSLVAPSLGRQRFHRTPDTTP